VQLKSIEPVRFLHGDASLVFARFTLLREDFLYPIRYMPRMQRYLNQKTAFHQAICRKNRLFPAVCLSLWSARGIQAFVNKDKK
jgi:hypothetical protein